MGELSQAFHFSAAKLTVSQKPTFERLLTTLKPLESIKANLQVSGFCDSVKIEPMGL